MATTAQYLSQLVKDKEDLIAILKSKGLEVNDDATFSDLLPSVGSLKKPSGGSDAPFTFSDFDQNGFPTKMKIGSGSFKSVPKAFFNGTYTNSYGSGFLTKLDMVDFTSDVSSVSAYGLFGMTMKQVNFNKISSIGERGFASCLNLESVKLGQTVSGVSNYAFRGCTNLKDVVFDCNIKYANSGIFFGCTKLAKLDIGEKIESLDKQFIFNCDALTTFILRNPNQVVSQSSITSTSFNYANCSVYVPDDLIDAYKSSTSWSKFAEAGSFKPLSELSE